MKIHTSYSVRIQGYSAVLDRTVALYRSAVDFFIDVMLRNWQQLEHFPSGVRRLRACRSGFDELQSVYFPDREALSRGPERWP